MNPFYDLLKRLDSADPVEEKVKSNQPLQKIYETVEARGSIGEAVRSLATRYEDFVTGENAKLDETKFDDKDSFDKLAEPGDTYKTADGGTVTKTEKGIKHSAPSGKYGAGPEDEKDDLDEENVSKDSLEESNDIRNHPIYTNEEAWDHYKKELDEEQKDEVVDIQDELNELNRLAGLAEKVGGNPVNDYIDDVTHKEEEVEEGFDPESLSGEMDYEFTGDDGETGYGSISYQANVVDGQPVIDPLSLRAHCNGDGNNKLTDEWCAEMVAPGGSEHDAAMEAAHEDATEAWQERDVDVPMDEDAIEEAVSRKDFQMVADLLKNIDDTDKRKELAQHHADMFAKQNPRFDRSRFMSAVGLAEDKDMEVKEGTVKVTNIKWDSDDDVSDLSTTMMVPVPDGMIGDDAEEFIADYLTDKTGITHDGFRIEDTVEEGNEFSGALAKAKEEGKKEFEVDGKTYKVEESMNEDINVTVNASGEQDALKLMMKLAGVQAVAVQAEEAIEEERDIEYVNTPREKTAPVSASIPSGTDLHKAKKSYPKVAGGDNPMALEDKELEESLWTNYQDMIKEVKKDENA